MNTHQEVLAGSWEHERGLPHAPQGSLPSRSDGGASSTAQNRYIRDCDLGRAVQEAEASIGHPMQSVVILGVDIHAVLDVSHAAPPRPCIWSDAQRPFGVRYISGVAFSLRSVFARRYAGLWRRHVARWTGLNWAARLGKLRRVSALGRAGALGQGLARRRRLTLEAPPLESLPACCQQPRSGVRLSRVPSRIGDQ